MELRRSKMVTYYKIAVWMALLITHSQTLPSQSTDERWTVPALMETVENHEAIQKYDSDSKIIFKKLVNPFNDSYINAYNFHDESSKTLSKRHTKETDSPQIFKFLSEDAKEPDEATKELIRVHRARELRLSKEDGKNTNLSGRTKRSVKITKPQLIKFEPSDAKEPDAATKELIRQSRAREMSLKKEQVVSTTTQRFPTKRKRATRKRTRRSPQQTPPNFIRFQLNDAIEMQNGLKAMLPQTVKRDSMESLQSNGSIDLEEPSVQESKRYAYHTVPMKPGRIPTAVQKTIGRIIKERDAKVYYKYIHPHTETRQLIPIYETGSPALPASPSVVNFSPLYSEQAYVSDTATIHTIPMNILPSPIHQQPPRPVPVHSPVQLSEVNINHQYYPISPQPNAAVYHQPTTYLKAISADAPQAYNQVAALPYEQKGYQLESSLHPVDGNELSNRYPYVKLISLDEPSQRYGKQSHFKESGGGGTDNQQVFVNKDSLKFEQHQIPLEDIGEFRQLSALIGKSPTDQIHGLAYLLAKQMQRAKNMRAKRPHDNTAPILFHPENNRETVRKPKQFEVSNVYKNHQPLALSNNVLEVSQVEQSPSPIDDAGSHNYDSQDNSKASVIISKPPAPPQPTSFSVVKLGVSPNCKENDRMLSPRAILEAESQAEEEHVVLQNAPKYAFGYRVRDFHSANDFGHKQNRDVDGVTRGQYHILLPDGRVQNVIYHADDTGFHADVSFKTSAN